MLGVCGVAPAIMINDEMYGKLIPERVDSILRRGERTLNTVRSHVLISIDAGRIMAGARAVQAELIEESKGRAFPVKSPSSEQATSA